MEQATHRRVVVRRRGGPDVLEVVQEPRPRPAAGEVRVKVLAAGVSAFDLMVRSRFFPGFPRLPFTARAHELLERGGHAGKVVLVTGP